MREQTTDLQDDRRPAAPGRGQQVDIEFLAQQLNLAIAENRRLQEAIEGRLHDQPEDRRRNAARRAPPLTVERPGSRAPWLRRLLFLAFCLVVLAVIGVVAFFVGFTPRPQGVVVGTATARADYQFLFPPETAPDRILLKTGVGITLTHLPTLPDKITLTPSGGDIQGSFTWTVIPHQGSDGVRRLIGEVEFDGRVYKVCEALDDQASHQPQYAERYFPINNSGDLYSLPQRADQAPFINFLTTAIAQTPERQQIVGRGPRPQVNLLAANLLPLCTGLPGAKSP